MNGRNAPRSFFVKTGRNETPHLIANIGRHQRKTEKNRDLNIGKESILRGIEEQLGVFAACAHDVGHWLRQNRKNLFGEGKANNHTDKERENGSDDPCT